MFSSLTYGQLIEFVYCHSESESKETDESDGNISQADVLFEEEKSDMSVSVEEERSSDLMSESMRDDESEDEAGNEEDEFASLGARRTDPWKAIKFVFVLLFFRYAHEKCNTFSFRDASERMRICISKIDHAQFKDALLDVNQSIKTLSKYS